ncbi:hypothetical protein LWI29_008971 [Acer saccharum]|uniref:Retrotransposon gag domain-containing protein n=1 Tax=Acer saccharum TaxID=4024 RepID=A0AA39T144_ACESA|nr:hypothetical protein LWI29_008971 [Acer saccharum]
MLQWKQEPKASVDQYTERFHELTVRSKAVETEVQTLARYLNGLKTSIRKDMLTARVYSVEEAYQLALQLEKQKLLHSSKFNSFLFTAIEKSLSQSWWRQNSLQRRRCRARDHVTALCSEDDAQALDHRDSVAAGSITFGTQTLKLAQLSYFLRKLI